MGQRNKYFRGQEHPAARFLVTGTLRTRNRTDVGGVLEMVVVREVLQIFLLIDAPHANTWNPHMPMREKSRNSLGYGECVY